jgi:hypothetical protein
MATIRLPHDFKNFLRLLDTHDVDYLLVGGYAVGYHGYPRATADMDIWVSRTHENAQKLVAVRTGLPAVAVVTSRSNLLCQGIPGDSGDHRRPGGHLRASRRAPGAPLGQDASPGSAMPSAVPGLPRRRYPFRVHSQSTRGRTLAAKSAQTPTSPGPPRTAAGRSTATPRAP